MREVYSGHSGDEDDMARLQTTVDDTDAELRRAARHLRLDLGWATTVRGGLLTVELDDDLSAIELSHDLADQVLTRLRARGLDCPVAVAGGAQTRCVLFFRPDAGEVADADFPAGVAVLPAGRTVVLPPSVALSGRVHWLSSPWSDRVSLPSADELAAAVALSSTSVAPAADLLIA